MGGEVLAHQRAPGGFAEQAHADRETVAQQAEQIVEQQPLVDRHAPRFQACRRGHRLRVAQVRGERMLLCTQGIGSLSHDRHRRAWPAGGGWSAARPAVRHRAGN
ncbi:hypothetical protein G6F60_014791 [Rhizopus arrhizus]|nr:hypothetical protein G6F60_014791 [Rhizopus arrhizus]